MRDTKAIARLLKSSEQVSASNSTDLYHHEPLQHEWEIRLLCIAPGRHADDIHCTIIHERVFPVDGRLVAMQHAYEALSYTWGSATNVCPLRVGPNGEFTYVSHNCVNAVRRLRLENTDRTVWIDAVCINQEDAREKSHQIQLMPLIYAGARKVSIYLGEESDHSALAMDLIDWLVSGSNEWSTHWEEAFLISRLANVALLSLLERPWFYRVWVVQETVNAQHAVVVCGDRTISWAVMVQFWAMLYSSNTLPVAKDRPGVLALWPSTVLRVENGHLMGLLQRLRNSLCHDPRDKVFALYGIMADAKTHGLEADYTLSQRQVYIRTATYAIRQFKALTVLSEVIQPARLPDLPSWVPDWTTPVHHKILGDLWESVPHYQAGGPPSRTVVHSYNDLERGLLRTQGIVLGSVNGIGPVYNAGDRDDILVLNHWSKMALRLRSYGSEGVIHDQLSVLLTGDQSLMPKVGTADDNRRQYFLWRHLYLGEDVEGNKSFKRSQEPYLTRSDEISDRIDAATAFGAERLYAEHQSIVVGKAENLPGYDQFQAYIRAFRRRIADRDCEAAQVKTQDITRCAQHSDMRLAKEYHEDVRAMSSNRSFITTDSGHMGLAPKHTQLGDIAVVLPGAAVPYILRQRRDAGGYINWTLVGEAYVNDAMHGEALPDACAEEFRIV